MIRNIYLALCIVASVNLCFAAEQEELHIGQIASAVQVKETAQAGISNNNSAEKFYATKYDANYGKTKFGMRDVACYAVIGFIIVGSHAMSLYFNQNLQRTE